MPVLRKNNMLESLRNSMGRLNDGIPVRNGKFPARAEIVLHIDDYENILWSDLQFSVPYDGHLSTLGISQRWASLSSLWWKPVLYQGTTSVVPLKPIKRVGL